MTPIPENINKSWSLFLDRDGVINRRIAGGYVRLPEEFIFLPRVPESLAVFGRIFGRIVIVTNQQGIGKGLMDEKQLEAVHQKMLKGLEKAGGRIDAVFYCPDLADKPDTCRKPSSFLAMEAKKQFPEIDFRKSIMVGDTETDMIFGRNAGMVTVLVGDGTVPQEMVDFKVRDLFSFALLIKKNVE